jgi:hypothetical protein
MKNKILSIIAAAYCLVACDLTHTPLAALSPETFFSNESELQAFSNTFYTSLTVGGFDEISDMLTKNVLTDEIMGSRTVPNSGGGWSYTALRNFNTLIEYSVNCPDEKIRTQYVALARFFRANFYFDKVKRFGDVPWYDKQLGSDDPGLYKPRDSREFVMSKVIEDLDFAIANLPDTKDLYRITKWTALALKSRACLFEGTFRKYHAGQSTLETLPADAKPYTYYLELSAAASEEIMNTSGYSIFRGNGKATAYRDLFLGDPADDNNAYAEEVILARDYNKALNILHNSTFFTIGNYGNQSMTRKMACTYLMDDGTRYTDKEGWQTKEFADEMKNRDPRMAQSVRTPGYKRIDGTEQLAPNFTQVITGYQPIKYMLGLNADADRFEQSHQDLHIYRYAEILLNYAEAKAELGILNQSDVDRSIKLLRDRVGMPNMNLTEIDIVGSDPFLLAEETGYPNVKGQPQEAYILEIRRERSVELFDEDMRHTDLIRWRNCANAYNHKFLGFYVANAEGQHDLDKNGTIDVWFYSGSAPAANEIPTGCVIRKIGEQTYFTGGNSGYIIANPIVDGKWNDERDYYYPIPIDERSLNPNLTQNKGWNDGLE